MTEETKNPVGRPTKYTPELIEKAREFVASKRGQFTMIAELALELGLRRETVHVWAKDPEKQEFSNIVEELQSNQELYLAKGTLNGDLNATMAKLLLTKHGYSDKQDLSSSDGTMTPKDMPTTIRLVGPDE